MTGVFSIAEVIDSCYTKGKRTFLQVKPKGFTKPQLKSLEAVVKLVNEIGGIAFTDNDPFRMARVLNGCFKDEGYKE